MIVARIRLARVAGPSYSRQAALGRARHVGRGDGHPSNRREIDQ
jgi:hypothetical protein